jgi:Coenzyme PQQ synthesis protein D (PqqD)
MGERFRLRNAGLEWRSVEGEVVALDLPKETYLGVNRSGSVLWQALAQGATPEELTELLVAEYGIDSAEAERDVTEFIAAMQQHGVLEPAAG